MVQLSSETVQEFKKLFKEEYGVEYSDAEAWEAAHNLVGFYDLLLKIDQRNKERNSETKGGVDCVDEKSVLL